MKELLVKELIERVKGELFQVEEAARANHAFATDQEFKAESKYDTRSLEASYLASAEMKRAEELKLEIQMLEEVDLDTSARLGEISIGALVELIYDGQKRLYFLIPTAGGTLLKAGEEAVVVVSVFSPIGNSLIGLKIQDEFEVETPKETRSYKVLSFT